MVEQGRQLTLEQYIRDLSPAVLHTGPKLERKLARKTGGIQTIINTVADGYLVTPNELKGPSRLKDLVEARHIAIYLMYECEGVSFRGAALSLGRNDHTTGINAVQNVERRMQEDPDFKERVDELKANYLGVTA